MSINGLWCDDITFCPMKCEWHDCPRNQLNIRDRTVPHSYFLTIPDDCPHMEMIQFVDNTKKKPDSL